MATNATGYQVRLREKATPTNCAWGDLPLPEIFADSANVTWSSNQDATTGQVTWTASVNFADTDTDLVLGQPVKTDNGDGTSNIAFPIVDQINGGTVVTYNVTVDNDINTFATMTDTDPNDGKVTLTLPGIPPFDVVTDVCAATANDPDVGQLCF